MSGHVTPDRYAEFNQVLASTTQWAESSGDIRAVGLAGSWTRGRARMDSDLDIVVLTDRRDAYVRALKWMSQAAGSHARMVHTRQWGALTERRVVLPSGFEIEYGFAPTSWADTAPVDQGTASVVTDGFRILYDPDDLLTRLVQKVGHTTAGTMPVEAAHIRGATPGDVAFLCDMLGEAMAWRPGSPPPDRSVIEASHYIAGWPKLGDGGVVVEMTEPIGAAWYRMLPPEDPGYGFIDARTPEVTIGVRRRWRGQGLGRRLLKALADMATEAGYDALTLSVEEDNYALGLYEAAGFERVELVGNAWTMVLRLPTTS